MAKSPKAIIFLASALCFLSILGFAYGENGHFKVEGKVYCDTCRFQFITRVSEYMSGAKIQLECRDREGGNLTYSIEGETDASGSYSLAVEGEHEEEVCEIVLVESSNPDCAEVNKDYYLRRSARISLTTNNGITSSDRLANPLGFMRKDPLPQCAEVLKELGIIPDGLV